MPRFPAQVVLPLLCAALLGADSAAAGPVPGDRVLLTQAQALAEIFPGHGAVFVERFALTDPERAAIATKTGSPVPDGAVRVLRVMGAAGDTAGFALVLDERGKYKPITFMVGVGRDLAVCGVQVMVYREDRGDEVKRERFLRQYRGKRSSDPIRTHKDVVNVTGATISVQSMNRGVRRALATLELLYKDARRAPLSIDPLHDRA